jgi:hypothetical protein
MTAKNRICWARIVLSCGIAVVIAGAAHAQAPQGQEPGLLENLSSDAVAFYQRYRLYILAVLAVVFLRWLWTAVTPRGYRD